jgi:glutaredoxin-related protein
MSIVINVFSQAFIDGILSVLKPPTTFLLDTFWGGAPQLHEVDSILVDIEVEGQKLAAFVTSEDGPVMVSRTGYGTNLVKTPKILMITELNPRDFIDNRAPGQAGITSNSDPKFKQRVGDELAKILKAFKDMRVRTEEWMAAQAAISGAWIVTLPTGKKYSIDFKRPETHSVTLTGADLWSATTTADPLKVIDTKSQLIVRGSGVQATHIVMNKTTKQSLFGCVSFQNQLNRLNIKVGNVDTTQSMMQAGAKKFAEIDGREYWEYDATYTDYAGATQLYVPDGKVIIGAKHAGNIRHYGPIEDFDAMPDIRLIEFSKNDYDKKPPTKWWTSYESHPLVATHKPECFVCLTVL